MAMENEKIGKTIAHRRSKKTTSTTSKHSAYFQDCNLQQARTFSRGPHSFAPIVNRGRHKLKFLSPLGEQRERNEPERTLHVDNCGGRRKQVDNSILEMREK
ncbi:hypothetical protein T4E_3585 [Trichinella pseudospiralis]|uniref:Uncharacterized protein n=1 Tax=Trichinella pseudospiralis TaxID=6337 RepID=A0A0V1FNM5_TRIPS|nr:hypothetical protein T4E_3585 [Trichinella pseudospiralis]KRY87639.1 hypothetical protein T4D_7995 [Trichinella pseudospiralis]